MKLYHINGKIVDAHWDRDEFIWQNNTNNAVVFEIDEVSPDNKALCLDFMRKLNAVNEAGEHKYYIDANELYEREGWVEYNPDILP